MKVGSKREFFELWEAGVLGNRTRLWRDPGDAFDWGERQSRCLNNGERQSGLHNNPRDFTKPEIGFREIGKTGGGKWEKVPWAMVFRTARKWQAEGRRFIMDDGAPDQYRTMQGEVCRTYKGMEGYLEVGGRLPMRQALAAGLMKHRTYLEVRILLQRFMDPSSREDLDALLELYPDAAVEFTCFSVNVGILPGRNTLFWETRDY